MLLRQSAEFAASASPLTDLLASSRVHHWLPLLEIQGTGEVLELLDTEAPRLPRYFYRIVPLP